MSVHSYSSISWLLLCFLDLSLLCGISSTQSQFLWLCSIYYFFNVMAVQISYYFTQFQKIKDVCYNTHFLKEHQGMVSVICSQACSFPEDIRWLSSLAHLNIDSHDKVQQVLLICSVSYVLISGSFFGQLFQAKRKDVLPGMAPEFGNVLIRNIYALDSSRKKLTYSTLPLSCPLRVRAGIWVEAGG